MHPFWANKMRANWVFSWYKERSRGPEHDQWIMPSSGIVDCSTWMNGQLWWHITKLEPWCLTAFVKVKTSFIKPLTAAEMCRLLWYCQSDSVICRGPSNCASLKEFPVVIKSAAWKYSTLTFNCHFSGFKINSLGQWCLFKYTFN